MIKLVRRIYDIFSPFIKKLNDDNIFAISGQSAFYLLLTLIPFTMFAVSILQNLHIPVSKFDSFFSVVFNERASSYISNYLGNVNGGTVSVSLITMIVTLWSAAKGIHAIMNGLNRIHHTYENRNWFLVRLRAMFYTVVFVFILFATAFLTVLGQAIAAKSAGDRRCRLRVQVHHNILLFGYPVSVHLPQYPQPHPRNKKELRLCISASGSAFVRRGVDTAVAGDFRLRRRFQRLFYLRRTR